MKKWEKYSEKELREIYNNSNSLSEFYRKIGYKGWNSTMTKEIQDVYPWFQKKEESLIGKRFGRLKVISQLPSQKKQRVWKCKCDCGNITTSNTNALNSGRKQSCGCLARELTTQRQLIDLTGKTFDNWYVIERDNTRRKKHKVYWKCKCLNCGTIKSVDGASLRQGLSSSCGCITSKGEMWIKEFLENYQIRYQYQYVNDKLRGDNNNMLYMDFYLPDFNTCIEYQGIQHYQPIDFFGGEKRFKKQQQYDEIKRQYCNREKISLLEIPYTLSKKEVIKLLKDKFITKGNN